MADLRITGFGKLTLACQSQRVATYPTQQVEELLGYLLLNQLTAQDREELIDMLWPAQIPKNGRGSLSTVLWRLRSIFRQLGFRACAFIDSTRGTVSFRPQCDIQFDVHLFERALIRARHLQFLAKKTEVLEEAVDLYKGSLYSTIYADWCLVERERLARLHLQALGQLMYCYMHRNLYPQAIDLGERILIEDPLREEIYRAKMICYARVGRRMHVAREFRRCTDQLQTQLAILPSPQTVKTYQESMYTCFQASAVTDGRTPDPRLQQAFLDFQEAGDRE